MRTIRSVVVLCIVVAAAPLIDPPTRTAGAEMLAAQSVQATAGPAVLGGMAYRFVGPARGGRVTAVEGHPSHPHTFYQGATGGGVWKTTNYGMSWKNISDGFFLSPSIGHIEVADSDPNIIYVGTGSDGIRSNIIIGKGVYKSEDAGETWSHIGLGDGGQIGAVKAHPGNPDLVYAAVLGNPFKKSETRGVYRSANGGLEWEQVLFTSDSVGAVDLEFHPDNPNVIYAGMWRAMRHPWSIISGSSEEDGIWKSADGGDTWRRMSTGLPDGLVGKVDFSVSADMPDRVYALVEAPEPVEGLYRSDDAGETWELVNDDPSNRLMHRPFYFTNVIADPSDGDVVFVLNLATWKSTDGGATFQTIPNVHGDDHDLWINPDDSRVMVHGSDGGGVVTLDGGQTWSPVNNQPTAELYQVDVDDRFPYWLYAGQQDDAYTVSVPSSLPSLSAPGGPDAYWRSPGGCETGPAVPKPGDPDIVYTNCKGRFGVYNQRTGQEQQYYVGAANMYGTNPANLRYRFQRVVPIEVSPHDPNTVYHGSQYVHRTTDGGRSWDRISPDLTAFRPDRQMVSGGPITRDATGEEHYSTLYVIEASPHDANVIWAGANDGPVHVTFDGGGAWNEVTPTGMPPEGRINSIDISRHDPDKVYVAGYRYLLGDFAPYAYRTEDAGETWELLTSGDNGIPSDYPVRVVREDPDREGLLYAGTDYGVFISFDDGASWQSLQFNLPVTPVTDIEVYRHDLVLSTMGRGFWVLDDITPLHEMESDGSVMAAGPVHLFDLRQQYRMRPPRNSGYEWASNLARPQYRRAGADINYWISQDRYSGEAVRIDIMDSAGEVLRSYTSGVATGGPVGSAAAMARFASGGTTTQDVSAAPGAHRLRWDLRASVGERRGPIVPPGEYTVRLSRGDDIAETRLTLRIDPRVAAEGVTAADLEEQYRFNIAVMETRSEAQAVAGEIGQLRERIEAEQEEAGGGERNQMLEEAARRLARLDARLRDADGSYPRPMLLSQINYLAGMTSRADQAPGRDAYERHDELRAELAELREAVQVLTRRLAAAST